MNRIRLLLLTTSMLFSSVIMIHPEENKQPELPRLSNALLFKAAHHANSWVAQYVVPLSAEEACLILNMLYFCHTFNDYDVATRNQTQALAALMIIMRSKMENAELLEHCSQAFEQFKETCSERLITMEQWQTCLTHIESLKNPLFIKAMDVFKQQIQDTIKAYCDEHDNLLNNTLTEANKLLMNNSSALHEIAKTYNELVKDNLPIESTPETKKLLKLSVASHFTDTLAESSFQTIQIGAAIAEHTNVLQVITNSLFALYYSKVHALLTQRKEQVHILFDEKGIVTANKRMHLLPSQLD